MCPDVPPRRLLLIDDDETAEPAIREALDEAFGDIERLTSLTAGLTAIREQRHEACLLRSDLEGQSTIDLLRQVVEEGCEMPVLVLTRDEGQAQEDAAMEAGAADTLPMNRLDPYLLNRTIRHAIKRRHWLGQHTQSNARLAQSNAALQRFAYVASHDLQEPLRAVSGYLQLFQQKYKGVLDEAGCGFIDLSLRAAGRMRQLILDLLAYSRIGAGERQPTQTNTTKVFQQVLDNLQVQIKELDATVTHDELPEVLIDPTQLAQLLQNLISNAIKFVNGRPSRVHLSVEPQGERCQFCVRDNGIGIDESMYERVFEVFHRLHPYNEYPGSGIGLAVCKQIVEQQGGRIWVESLPGEGAAFYFTLPMPSQGKEEFHARIAA